MASESTSSQQPQQLIPSSKVNFNKEDGTIAFNNVVALLEYSNELIPLGVLVYSRSGRRKFHFLPNQSLYIRSGSLFQRNKSLRLSLLKSKWPPLTSPRVYKPSSWQRSKETSLQPLKPKRKIVEMEEDAKDHFMEIPTVEQLLDAVDKQIKMPKLQDQIMHDSDESVDYESMLEDDLRSVSGFEDADSDDTLGNEVSHSDHTFSDHNDFVDRLSLPDHLDHICEKVIIHQVSDGINDRFARLETELSKTLKSDMGKSVTNLVKSGVKEVRDDLKSQANDIQRMQTQLYDIQSLLESAVIIDNTAEGEKNKKVKDPNPVATQGEPQSAEPLVESQGEQLADLNIVNKE
nr:hypothetical protein [Tanacetum cinerariifolium]